MLLEAGRKPTCTEILRAASRICAAAASMALLDRTCTGALMLRAATLCPEASKMGAATQRRPSTPSSSSMA